MVATAISVGFLEINSPKKEAVRFMFDFFVLGFQLLMQFFGLLLRVIFYLCINPGPLLPVAAAYLLQDYLQFQGVGATGAWVMGISVGCLVALLRWCGAETIQFLMNLPRNIAAFISASGDYINHERFTAFLQAIWQNKQLIGSALIIIFLVIAVGVSRISKPLSAGADDEIGAKEVKEITFAIDLPAFVLANQLDLLSPGQALGSVEQKQLDLANKHVNVKIENLEARNIAPASLFTGSSVKPECFERINAKQPAFIELAVNFPMSKALCESLEIGVSGLFGRGETILTPDVLVELDGKQHNIKHEFIEAYVLEFSREVRSFTIDLASQLQGEEEYLQIVNLVTVRLIFPAGDIKTDFPGEMDNLYLTGIWIKAKLAESSE